MKASKLKQTNKQKNKQTNEQTNKKTLYSVTVLGNRKLAYCDSDSAAVDSSATYSDMTVMVDDAGGQGIILFVAN